VPLAGDYTPLLANVSGRDEFLLVFIRQREPLHPVLHRGNLILLHIVRMDRMDQKALAQQQAR